VDEGSNAGAPDRWASDFYALIGFMLTAWIFGRLEMSFA
jgi:hypothetical protein